jgi:hypothetical protein
LSKQQQSLGPGIILVETSQYSVGQKLTKKCTCCAYTLLMGLSRLLPLKLDTIYQKTVYYVIDVSCFNVPLRNDT